jgi:predicted nucleic acid-binding protein
MLNNIQDGTHCFVDANVIAYFIAGHVPFAPLCETFFKRVEAGVISASTSAAMVSEATHKVMLAEALEQHCLNHQGLAHRLQRKRDLITTLSKHQRFSGFVRALGIHVEAVTLDLIERAAQLSV